jgi:VCBS repeat-containing protein
MAAPKTTNAAPTFTTAAQSTSFTEIADTTGSTALASYSTTVSFADANTADTHKVAVANVTASGTTTGLPGKTTLLSWLKSGTLTQAAGSGSFTLSFSAADRSFDYLAAGQTLTLTYTVQLSDNKGAVTSQNFTVTITGTNDLPVIGNPSMAMVTEDKSATKAGLLWS